MIDNKKIEEASFEETFGMYGEADSLPYFLKNYLYV